MTQVDLTLFYSHPPVSVICFGVGKTRSPILFPLSNLESTRRDAPAVISVYFPEKLRLGGKSSLWPRSRGL